MSVTAEMLAESSAVFGASDVQDPYPLFAERRSSTPVMDGDILATFGIPSLASRFDGSRRAYTLFRHDDIQTASRDSATFSGSIIFEGLGPFLGRIITSLDGEEHRKMRALFAPGFAGKFIDDWRERIVRPLVRSTIEGFAAAKREDLYKLTLYFPVRAIYEIMGFPDDFNAFGGFQAKAMSILLGFGSTDAAKAEQAWMNVARAMEAAQSLYDTILPIVKRRRAEGAAGEDLMWHLLRSELDGEKLDDVQITTFLRSLTPAAAETTMRSFSNVLFCLLSHPEVLAEVRADRSLVPQTIDEVMRYESAVTVNARVTTRDVEMRGVTIPAGSGITLLYGSGNRDPEAFDNPDTFDIHRTKRGGLSFGHGPHHCLGLHVAKMEMEVALNEVLDLLPNLRFDPAAKRPEIRGVQFRSPTALPVVWD